MNIRSSSKNSLDISVLWEDFKTITVASVVPRATQIFLKLKNEKEIITVSNKTRLSFSIKVPEPETVGADRLANMEGAIHKHKPPFVIIDCGTAITFDVLNAKKEYIGGAICPGIYTSADALFSHASKIFGTSLEKPENVIGDTTKKNLQSGIVYRFRKLNRRDDLADQKGDVLRRNKGDRNGRADRHSLRQRASSINTIDKDLTLEGLFRVYQNEKKNR